MTGSHSRSRAASRSKRKNRYPDEQQSESQSHSTNSHRTKRCRVASSSFEPETPTLIPDPPRTLPVHNRFQHLHSSSGSRRKQRDQKSNATEVTTNRNWVFSSHDLPNYKDTVVVVSYNILGVENASNHPYLYYKVPPKFLDWDRRKILIHEEINRYNASILCFQEVDRFDDLEDLLKKDGFVGIHKARTGEACDGCAIFWKEKLFTVLHQENIEFRRVGLRDNVAQLCVLEGTTILWHDKQIKMIQNQSESKSSTQTSMSSSTQSRRLLVGNIHVLFNPNRGDIKLGQVRLLLEKAYALSQEWGKIPVIIGGDLNSKPQSAMYQFLASSKLDIQQLDRREISGQLECPSQCRGYRPYYENATRSNVWMSIPRPLLYTWSDEELRLATGSGGVTHVQHQLKLLSAYLGVPGSSRTRDIHGEPLATSYHSKFMGTVDYIWHTEELVPVRVLETLPIDTLRRSGGLPSEKWGSDHLALVCELAFADDVKGT
ncbi:carbon catabolite repressor protein 4 homolog 5 isoform X1 [Quercus robur]|uniref:carbon catabolite repressor protein 4 homolog 5 isoform X1 n=1 Tax=Quercus robur TaxID=38942 RepID=UPI0021633994|nr:carbon catabolite repressor protein 4 homolog 5 isoform X1 [Quercus robur]